MDGHQQQYIQLARRPSPADATPPATMQPNDGARLVMCPSLYLAAYRGRTEEVMALLLQQHGAGYQATGIIQHGQCDILEVSAEGNTVLHVAAEQGHNELIRELYLRFREEEGLLSRRNSALDTPLHCAASAGHVRAIAVLIQLVRDCGENILGCKNEAGDTALHLAASHGHGGAVEVLVSAAVEPAAEENNAGMSPLYLAVMSGSVRAVRAIIRACRDASSDGPRSQNALHAAIFRSSEMVHLLLEWRPTLADQVDSSGSSPLHFAASTGDCTIVRAILHAAPQTAVYTKDSSGLSALHVAARMGHHRVIKDMLGTCPHAGELRDHDGGNFVHAAAREKRSKVVSLAVKNPMLRGILDAHDRHGNTPLHLAVAAGAPDVVEALLRRGKVRADVLNNDGRTPFDLAAGSTSFFTMVKLVVTLVAFGAQLGPQRHDHLTPWSDHYAAEKIEKSSDILAVVAALIATAAFTAGFNMPGGYGDTGEASLAVAGKPVFKAFLFLDTLAVATSMAAVILLVYGKSSRSTADSWKSFAWALQLMWVSLIVLLLAFYAALVAAVTTRAVRYGFMAVLACIFALQFRIATWIGDEPQSCTVWRFIWLRFFHSKGRDGIIRRQYPLVCASVFHFFVFQVTSVIAFFCVGAILGPDGWRLATSSAPAPSPL
ncbi:unnamed protein product [Urochloa decumbens]|uniref:PGG domain-containing protein n=1 Tax=Urochloa decumbens TaxID=240449 RepID=A0ABC9AWS9_9POAL